MSENSALAVLAAIQQPLNVPMISEETGAAAPSGKGFKFCSFVDEHNLQCSKRSFSKGLCRKHGGNYCEVEGCTKDSGRLRMCIEHFYLSLPKDGAEYTQQQITDLEKMNRKQQTCKHEGCLKQMVVKQYCVQHARSVLGDDAVNSVYHRASVKCKFDGCDKRYSIKGYCLKHAREMLAPGVIKAFQDRNNEKGRRNYHKKKELRGSDDGIGNGGSSGSLADGPKVGTVEVQQTDDASELIDVGDVGEPHVMTYSSNAILGGENVDLKSHTGRKAAGGRKMYCKVEDCGKIRVRQGYCTKHLREMTDSGGSVLRELYRKSSKVCKADGCEKHASLKGYCLSHAHNYVKAEDVREYLDKKREQNRRT